MTRNVSFYDNFKLSPQELHRDKSPKHFLPYLPTPPLGQDITQGQFLKGV